MIIVAWFVLQEISKSSEFAVLAPPSRLVLTVGAWFVLRGIFKSFEFAGVGSAVGAGFENRGLVCIAKDF